MSPNVAPQLLTTGGHWKWPSPPDQMTVSTLLDIEACPRRWALSSADYPDLWSGRGYPARVHIGAVRGSVAHLVVETVMRDLVQAGCSSAQDGAAVQVMKARGGYTRVVSWDSQNLS